MRRLGGLIAVLIGLAALSAAPTLGLGWVEPYANPAALSGPLALGAAVKIVNLRTENVDDDDDGSRDPAEEEAVLDRRRS